MEKTIVLIMFTGIQLVWCDCPALDIFVMELKNCSKIIGEFLNADEKDKNEHCPAMGRAIACYTNLIDECQDNIVISSRSDQLKEEIDFNRDSYISHCESTASKQHLKTYFHKCIAVLLLILFIS